MKILKYLLLILLVAVGLLLIAGAIMPKDYEYSTDISIDAPAPLVFNHLKSLKLTHEWSPWAELDPNQETTYEGEEGTVGSAMHWVGNKDVGKGSQTITAIEDMQRVETKLVFIEPFESEADAILAMEADDSKQKVTWTMKGEFGYPMNALMPLMGFKNSIMGDFQKGLGKLKNMVEAKAANPVYEGMTIQRTDLPAVTYIGYREKIGWDKIGDFYGEQIGKLFKAGAVPAGPPSALFYEWDEVNQMTDMAVALPVESGLMLKGGFSETVEASKAAVIDYYGSYSGTGAAHEALSAYGMDHGLQFSVPVVEEYITDPNTEPDTTKWHTRVIYRIVK